MGIKYQKAPDLQTRAEEICKLIFPHVKIDCIACLRSSGSKSRGTIARCHALGKVMQLAMGTKAFYAIEFLTERFDRLSEAEQTRVIVHELMHIPKCFGGGFKHHDFVSERNVDVYYKKYMEVKNAGEDKSWQKWLGR